VLYELWYDVGRSARRRENAERLRVFLSGDIHIIPFGEEDARAAGELRAALEIVGTPVGSYDVLIAGHALQSGATLVTANVAGFARVQGLAWQDWTTEAQCPAMLRRSSLEGGSCWWRRPRDLGRSVIRRLAEARLKATSPATRARPSRARTRRSVQRGGRSANEASPQTDEACGAAHTKFDTFALSLANQAELVV
jgi:tRNA(fMet)-specific endonuclease VapC